MYMQHDACVHVYGIVSILYIAPGKGSKKAGAKDLKKADVKKGSGKEKDKVV